MLCLLSIESTLREMEDRSLSTQDLPSRKPYCFVEIRGYIEEVNNFVIYYLPENFGYDTQE